MAQRDLIDAFNDCVDRLATGQPLDTVLRQYPQYADKLAEMLRAANTARAAISVPESELAAARERVRRTVMNALADAPPYSAQLTLLPRVRRLLTAAAALLIVGFIAALLLVNRQQQFAFAESLTPPTATPSATPSATETAQPSATPTASPSPSLTVTPTHTVLTPQPSASVSPTDSGCVSARPDGWVTYRIRSGDTLSHLAAATGTTTQRIIDANCIENPSLLVVGQPIYLPRTPVASVPTATSPGGSAPSDPTTAGPGPGNPTATDDSSGHDDDDDDSGGNSGHGGDGDEDDTP